MTDCTTTAPQQFVLIQYTDFSFFYKNKFLMDVWFCTSEVFNCLY